jgi:predicted acylesterase/phospholipase RssA
VDADQHHEIRSPLDALEAEVVRRDLAVPGEAPEAEVAALRYVISLSRLTTVRNEAGQDVQLADLLAPHRWRVQEALRPHLEPAGVGLGGALRALPVLVDATKEARTSILGAGALDGGVLDRDSLEREITHKKLVVVAGGGGGCGYGYAGAYTLLNRSGLQPELIAGTSMGALMGLFRARLRVFDGAPMVAAGKSLSWQKVFRVLDLDSRYGVPATLRLYLRAAIGHLFKNRDGSSMTLDDLGIPMLVVVTGITVDGLKHDLDWFEHFLDDAFEPGRVFRRSRIKRLGRVVGILKEMMSSPENLREVVFGADPLTRQADVIDTVGFSSAIPGLIHYDIYRDDERMRRLLDQLYGEHGITRLLEGGLVNNLPCKPAFDEVMKGRIGTRNHFTLAMDCFAPSRQNFIFAPVMQLVRGSVKANMPYAHHVHSLKKRLNPLNMVPPMAAMERAMEWTIEELAPSIPQIQTMCRTLPVLPQS